MARPSRVRRCWRWPLYVGLGLGLLVALLWVGLQTSFAREQVRVQINSALSGLFRGKIEVTRIAHISPWGVSGVDARILDPEGKQVVSARGLSALSSLPRLGWQLLAHGDEPDIYIVSVHVDHAEVRLREDEELGVSLASTFLAGPDQNDSAPSSPASGPRLQIGRITIDSIWLHGRAADLPALDAELKHLVASLQLSAHDGFSLELRDVELLTRGMPLALDPRGHLTGSLAVPIREAGPLNLELALIGQSAGSPVVLDASWRGDELHARLSARRLPASFVNQQAPGLALDGELALVAEVDGPLPQLDFDVQIDGTAAHVTAAGYAVVADGLEVMTWLSATRVNLARLAAGAPQSAIELRARALLLEHEDGHFVLSHRVDVAPSLINGQRTPACWITGEGELGPGEDAAWSGRLGATEPGASALGGYRLFLPSRGHGSIAASLAVELEDPARLTVLGVHTRGKVAISAELQLDRRRLSAKAALSLRHLDYRALGARNIKVNADVTGALDDPQVRAAMTLEALSGDVRANLDYSRVKQTLQVVGGDLELVPLLQVLGAPLPIHQANLDFDVRVERSSPSANYRLNLNANADLGKLGRFEVVTTDFELPSSRPSWARLGAVEGELAVRGRLELEALAPLITAAGLPIEQTTGRLRFQLGARHRHGDAAGLELLLQVDTNGLRVVRQRKTSQEIATTVAAIDNEPVALEGIDLHFAARGWPRTGDAVGTLILRDAGGTLAEVQAEAKLAGLLPADLSNLDRLARVPLKVMLEMPTRRLQSLPPLIRPAGLRGLLSLEATADGSVAEPSVQGRVWLHALRASGAKAPIDVAAELAGDRASGSLKVDAQKPGTDAKLLTLAGRWRGDFLRVSKLGRGTSGLTGEADLELFDFPLDVVPQILDRQVNGQLSGKLELTGFGRDARVDAIFRSTTLSVAKVRVREMSLSARTDGNRIVAALAMKAGQGTAKAALEADMSWGKRPLPQLGDRGTAKLETAAFQLETLGPLLRAYVSEIAGVLDAKTEVAVTANGTALSGTAKLSKGVLQLPAIGQRFSEIEARVVVADNQFTIEKLEARGTTGRVTLKGGARLDGFALRAAQAQIAIAKRESLPITFQGEALGDAWGHVNASFENPMQGERKLDIDVPDFHLNIPDMGSYGLQSMAADEDIEVGVRRADGNFVSLAVQPLEPGGKDETAAGEPARPLRIRVRLGNHVVVERGTSAQAQLSGELVILSGLEPDVTGRIELRGGKLDVSGKTFVIERGVIKFDGNDPGNPTITATARWDAPAYTVYAEYVGDVRNGRIRLHSEPPLTRDEIASLLLFGSPEGGAAGSKDPNADTLAVGVAGDTVTKGLNQVLDDITNLDVSARVDTTSGSARPELVFQVSPRVSAKVTRAVGSPAAGESPDRTFLTLELRLRRAWALSAVFGDHGGSALDLIWRHRY